VASGASLADVIIEEANVYQKAILEAVDLTHRQGTFAVRFAVQATTKNTP